jgi:hypothetical protein
MERKFQSLFGRIRTMLNNAGIKNQIRSGVWAECAMTVMFLSNVKSIKDKEVCPYELLFVCKPKLPTNLRSSGEIGVVTTKANIQSKLKSRGKPCMFVGYSAYHANDIYRMLNLDTKRIIQSRDIFWLNEAYHDWIDTKVSQEKETDDEDDDVIENLKIQEGNIVQDKLSSVKDHDELKKKKIYRAMRLLESSFNPEASTVLQDVEQVREILLEQANFALFSEIVIDVEPSSFDEGRNHDDPKARGKWRDAIEKKLIDMDKQQVWEIIKKEDIPEDRSNIKCKWIFKMKRNGIFRARLVACGYSQIPVIDFNESFAPVINEISYQIMVIAKLIWNLEFSIIDVETIFFTW